MEKFRALVKSQEDEAKKYKDIFREREDLNVYNPPEDMEYIQMDSSRIGRNDAWLENIRKDGYLDETLWIMHDMIHAGVAISDPKKP